MISFISSAYEFSSFALMSLIFLVQLHTYPLFLFVRESDFSEYHSQHMRRITWIVAPLMLTQLCSCFYLYFYNKIGIFDLSLILLIFLSTFFISVPIHENLLKQYSIKLIQKLIFTNWIRTVAWSLICILILYRRFFT